MKSIYHRLVLLFCLLAGFQVMDAQVLLDEDFSDWTDLGYDQEDSDSDAPNQGIELLRVSSHNDQDYVFFSFVAKVEFQLQEANSLTLYIDLDNDITTGVPRLGMGVDFKFNFGQRSGAIYSYNNVFTVEQADIGLVTSPTVSSEQFEIAISRIIEVPGQVLRFNDEFSYFIEDNISNGDRIPDEGPISKSLSQEEYDYPHHIISPPEADFRFMSYNLLRDQVFENRFSREAFGRILRATKPQILAIQEVYDHSSLEMANMINELYPPPVGGQWYHAGIDPDIILVSQIPIVDFFSSGGNGFFQLRAEEADVLVINCHLPCCENDTQRQSEVDAILRRLRDIQSGDGLMDLPEGSPVIITGDMNLVGSRDVQQSLQTGDIFNNGVYGPDFDADWGYGPLTDAIPSTAGLPFSFTWNNTSSSFFPGRLDYVIHSASSLDYLSGLSLYTPGMSPDSLSFYGLQTFDSDWTSDHIPVFADFAFPNSVSTSDVPRIESFARKRSIIVHDQMHILDHAEIKSIELFSMEGQLLRQWSGAIPGFIDMGDLPSGTYTARIQKSDSTREIQIWQKI